MGVIISTDNTKTKQEKIPLKTVIVLILRNTQWNKYPKYLFTGSRYFLITSNFYWLIQWYYWTYTKILKLDMIASYIPWPIPREGMAKKDVKIISTRHLSNNIKWTHILHANSYPQFSSATNETSQLPSLWPRYTKSCPVMAKIYYMYMFMSTVLALRRRHNHREHSAAASRACPLLR